MDSTDTPITVESQLLPQLGGDAKNAIEKLQVMTAFADAEVSRAQSRLADVKDEIESISVDAKRRIKALAEERARLETSIQSNQSNAAVLRQRSTAVFKDVLVAQGFDPTSIDRYRIRMDGDFNVVGVHEDAPPPKEK